MVCSIINILKSIIYVFQYKRKYCPGKSVQNNRGLLQHLLNLVTKSQNYTKKYQINPSAANKIKLCTYRNRLKSLLKIAEKTYYSNLFMVCRGDLNITWKNIKMIMHGFTTSKLPMEFTYSNNSVSGTKNIMETFNQYFLNIGVKLADKIQPSVVNYDTYLPSSLYLYPTDAREVISVCNILKKEALDMMKLFLGLLKLV